MTALAIPNATPLALWRKHKAAHTRALGAPMSRIPFTGDPQGCALDHGDRATAFNLERAKASKWAAWKARQSHGLPDDLSGWVAEARAPEASSEGTAWTVHLTPVSPEARNQGWQPVKIDVPAWATEDAPVIIDIEPETPPPCQHTATMALEAPPPVMAALPAPTPRANLPAIIKAERTASPVLVITAPAYDYKRLRYDPLKGLTVAGSKRKVQAPEPVTSRPKPCRINSEFRRSIGRQMA